VLFEWARGRRLGDALRRDPATVGLTESTGELLARLHEHGAGFDGGRQQPVIVGDNVASFLLPDRIPRNDRHYGTLFAEAIDRAQAAIDALWTRPPHPPHILHGDFLPANILVWRTRLTPIDFQDALWGFEVQDVAITMAALEPYPNSQIIATALRSGYERVRPWPADDTDVLNNLIGARHLSQLNIGYNLQRPGLEAFVARHATWLQEWMESR
jgi:Ser/Thr protein kinase RdoA (MazF antagonist)